MLNAEINPGAESSLGQSLITLMAVLSIMSRFLGAPLKVIKVIKNLLLMLIILKNRPHESGGNAEASPVVVEASVHRPFG